MTTAYNYANYKYDENLEAFSLL